jgi:hypothetical protein
MVNALAMSAGVRCPEFTRLGPMRLSDEGDVRYWHLADIGLWLHMSAFDPKRTYLIG